MLAFALLCATASASWTCTIRMHRSPNCDNKDRYWLDKTGKNVNYQGDVIWEWSATDDYKGMTWNTQGDWTRDIDESIDFSFPEEMIETFEDYTSAFSFTGDCAEIEIFDEDSFETSSVDAARLHGRGGNIFTPSAATLKSWNIYGYSDNCIFRDHHIRTEKTCHWACNTKHGCPGKTANCIQMRGDLDDDIGGFFMRPYHARNLGDPKPTRYVTLYDRFVQRMQRWV